MDAYQQGGGDWVLPWNKKKVQEEKQRKAKRAQAVAEFKRNTALTQKRVQADRVRNLIEEGYLQTNMDPKGMLTVQKNLEAECMDVETSTHKYLFDVVAFPYVDLSLEAKAFRASKYYGLEYELFYLKPETPCTEGGLRPMTYFVTRQSYAQKGLYPTLRKKNSQSQSGGGRRSQKTYF